MVLIDVVVYIIKVISIQAIFYSFYWFGLKNSTDHAVNRFYILLSLLVSLFIPFIHHPMPERIQPVLEFATLDWIAIPLETSAISDRPINEFTIPYLTILKLTYLIVISFYIARSIFHLFIFQKIKSQSELISSNWYSLFKTSHIQPFSFLSNVFIPKSLFGTSAFDQILIHECEHVKQKHSIDRMLMDFLVSLFWFNPFIYLYRNALIEIHEFQADSSVIRVFGDPIGYQEMLFTQLQPASNSGLVSHFNFSTIKKRIVMMNKTKNVGYSRFMYVLTLPLLAMVLFAFTSTGALHSVEKLAASIEAIDLSPRTDQLLFIDQEDRFRPSILPLGTEANFKVSSSYGMRYDPISKSKKMHMGLDLATAVGSEVLATADGEVIEVVSSPDGYGNFIVIQHGDVYQTKYGQLSEFRVKGGDNVKRGDVIALSGNSGQSTGPHLHYEVYKDKADVNPMDYIKNYKFSFTKADKLGKEMAEKKLSEENLSRIEAEVALIEAEKVRVQSEQLLAEAKLAQVSAMEAVKVEELRELEEMAVIARIKKIEEKEIAQVAPVVAAKEAELVIKREQLARKRSELIKDEERIRIELKEVIKQEKEAKEKVKEKLRNKEE